MASKGKIKPLPVYEQHNMAFMAQEFKERHGNLLSERARYAAKLQLKAETEAAVELAKASVEAKGNLSPRRKASLLTRKLRNIHGTLKNRREYAMHVDHHTGGVTAVQEPSYTNIVIRWTPIIGFNDAKSFKQNPKAIVARKNMNEMPTKWAREDPVSRAELWMNTALLDGKVGAWKLPDYIEPEHSGVIFTVEKPRASGAVGGGGLVANLVIQGIFREYPPQMIAKHPDLIFCSPRFWIENGVLRDI